MLVIDANTATRTAYNGEGDAADIHNAGGAARTEGKDCSANPYPLATHNYVFWSNGWHEANKDFARWGNFFGPQ